MRETRPPLDTTFFEVVQARSIALSVPLRTYLQSVLDVDVAHIDDLRMEQVFADVFYDFGEAPQTKSFRDAYIDLVDLYLRVIRETTNWLCADQRRGAPIGQLLAAAAKHADELDIITFNHDLVIENEIVRRSHLRQRWCLDQGYGRMQSSLSLLLPTAASTPTFPLHRAGGCDHDRPIRILKLHGSLNWVVRLNSKRPTSGLLSGSQVPKAHLSARRQLEGRETYVRKQSGRGRQRWTLWPLVVPPVYAKQALRGTMQPAWTDAREAIEKADRLVVFGYSLPTIDVEAEKLIQRAFAKNQGLPWIDVVNPDPMSATRFADMAGRKPMRWHPSLDAMLRIDNLA